MNTIATIEFSFAIVSSIALIALLTDKVELKSARRMRMCIVLDTIWLYIDALAYTLVGPKYPLALRYSLNMLSYLFGCVLMIAFIRYGEAYINERTKKNKWLALVPQFIMIIGAVAVVIEFALGHIVSYENGIETVIGMPSYISDAQILILLYLLGVVISMHKELGLKIVFLFAAFDIMPLVSFAIVAVTGQDMTVMLSSVSFLLLVSVLQRVRIQNYITRNEVTENLIGEFNAEREVQVQQLDYQQLVIESMAATYNIAYVVNLKEDTFKLIRMDEGMIRGERLVDTFTEAKNRFFALLPRSDSEKMEHELDYDTIKSKLSETSSYNVEYRVLSRGAIMWHEMNVTYIDKEHVAIGFADKDFEITKRHLEDRRFNEYFALYETDIDTDTLKIIIDSPWYSIGESGTVLPYAPAMTKFAESLEGEAKEYFEKLIDLKNVKEQFATEDKRSYSYRSHNVGDNSWVECTSFVTLRDDEGCPAMVTFGFSLIDSLGVFRQELQVKYKEALDVMIEQHSELESAREAADAANRSKTNFLFNMSHDIRTPMNAIRGFTALAKKSLGDNDKVAEYLDKIDISGDQLLHLINQVLEMARIESGKVEFEEKPINVSEEFRSMVTILSEQARTNGLDFVYSISDIEHNYIYADEARIGSITLNIAGNAMKYTPKGGRVRFELKEVASDRPGYSRYIYSVTDNGIGMSEEYLHELFVPFSREKNSTVSKIQGTGLGLAIVKNIVDLLGGDIKVQSEVGKGTRFDITLDFRICENALESEERKQIFKPGAFMGKRVLLVEDNAMNREIAMCLLGEYGFEVESAEDGDLAVDLVKKHFDNEEYSYFDCILMDVQMPRMNGYDATRAIRALKVPEGVHVPIIAMTANAFEEDKADALAAGMDDHSAKPIDLQKLLSSMAKFMK